MEIERKFVEGGFEIKDETTGEFEAVFSTFGVIDKHFDVTEPGAIKDGANVVVSAYGHGTQFGDLPVGKGRIHADSSEAKIKGKFFLDTQAGADTFRVVKSLKEDDLGEWSYGYQVKDAVFGEKDGEYVRHLKDLDVYEVSPVLVGAGVNTRTLSAKGAPAPFQDQVKGALEVVASVVAGAERIKGIREAKGKQLSQVNQAGLDELTELLAKLQGLLAKDVKDDQEEQDAITAELLSIATRLNLEV